jgi:hypothetical protein
MKNVNSFHRNEEAKKKINTFSKEFTNMCQVCMNRNSP